MVTMLLLVATSCANKGGDSITTTIPTTDSEAIAASTSQVLGVWSAEINPDTKTFTVAPDIREGTSHWPLSYYYPNVLTIMNYGFTPHFWADIRLKHPFTSTGIKAYDPRVIAIIPANPGVSFNYPMLNVNANNAVLLEPDGYTSLYDYLGGSTPGNANPFKAYFKDQPYRVWSNTGATTEIQRWDMNLAGFGGPLRFKLVVDVSTNHPNPPQPIVDNAPEPVKIDATIGQGLSQNGGSTDVTVTLLDWQGHIGIGGVGIEAPDLFYGAINLEYSGPGTNPNEYVYTSTIANDKLAPEGEYKILVSAWDQVTNIHIYNEFTVFVSHITYRGNLVWAKSAGEKTGVVDDDWSNAITTLSDNSIVITGSFSGLATFGSNEPNETTLTSDESPDIFIARYNLDGTLVWVKSVCGPNSQHGWAITALSDNSVVITGLFDDSATFGQGEINETILTESGTFIAKYNSNGTLAWAKSAEGAHVGFGITTLVDNSTVVTGYFNVSAIFGKGEINETIITSAGEEDIFIARYNPNGILVWAKRAGGSSYDVGYAITVFSDDSIVVTGDFWDLATFGEGEISETILTSSGEEDIFVARYNLDGTLVWAKRAGSTGGPDCGYAITTLSDNSMVAAGRFYGSATFGQDEINETVLASAGGADIFIARYNPNGTLVWAKSAGGQGGDGGYAITTLSDNSIVLTGSFSFAAVFGQGELNETSLNSAGWDDVFIARYHADGTLTWAKSSGGANMGESGSGVTALSDNSTVVTGSFRNSATFGQGEPNEIVLIGNGYDIFIARFEP